MRLESLSLLSESILGDKNGASLPAAALEVTCNRGDRSSCAGLLAGRPPAMPLLGMRRGARRAATLCLITLSV